MIDAALKRCLGQMIKGVQVVGATHGGVTRAYTSHWVTQVAFEEPIVCASVSPRHDTYPLMVESGRFAVSVLAADQIEPAQYFSYPGRKFHYVAPEYLTVNDAGWTIVPGSIAWFGVETFQQLPMGDHRLLFGRVVWYEEGRLKEPPLLYSARHGWRVTGGPAREKGVSVRDRLLTRVAEAAAGEGDVGADPAAPDDL